MNMVKCGNFVCAKLLNICPLHICESGLFIFQKYTAGVLNHPSVHAIMMVMIGTLFLLECRQGIYAWLKILSIKD